MSDVASGTTTWGEVAAAAAAMGLPPREVRWIVEEACGLDPSAWDRPATVKRLAAVDAMVARRLAGEPLQYVLGRWSFRSLDLMVDHRVLIPRPETEVVAGLAVDALPPAVRGSTPLAVDLGTGSGAIALSMVAEHPTVEVIGTDVDAAALAVARANATGVGSREGRRVTLRSGSWFEALPPEVAGRIDVIVSNPPYVADDEPLPPEVADWEPAGALRGGPDGLDAVRQLVAGAPSWLAPGGTLVVELAPTQAAAALDLAERAGLRSARIEDDLAGRPRALVARRPR